VVAAAGAPAQLTAAAGQARLRVTLAEARAAQLAGVQAALGPGARADGRVVTAPAPDGLASLAAAITRLEGAGAAVHQAGLEYPTLDEVFGRLTSETRPEREDGTGTHDGGSRRLETTAS
jgi:ABC-2 type transport system ATP-binding protein